MEPTATESTSSRQLLRHAVATVAYRGGKALRGAPQSFAEFKIGEKPRTPVQILAHIGDLYDWALSCAKGKQEWHESKPLPWAQEVQRFFKTLEAFDNYLATESPLGFPAGQMFQGAVADSLTHVGQIAMLRRLAGCPMRSENYFRAEIQVGRVGEQQAAPKQEF
ncbi:MAG TPA: hypothetical protein VI685_24080 [Candidatus Angelobacter sp.]